MLAETPATPWPNMIEPIYLNGKNPAIPNTATATAPFITPATAKIINPYQKAPSLENKGAKGKINYRNPKNIKHICIFNLSLNLLPMNSKLI